MEEVFELFNVVFYYVLIVGDGFGIGKEDVEYVVDVIDYQWDFGVMCCIQQVLCQLVSQFSQGFMDFWLCYFVQVGEVSCYGDWVVGQGVCLIDWIGGCQGVYYFMVVVEGVYWYFVVDDFFQIGQIWFYVVVSLSVCQCYVEVGYYFVDNQQGVKFVVQGVQVWQEFWLWWNVVYIFGYWFDDDVGDFLWILFECCVY